MPVSRLYTVEDVRAIPDDFNRYETIAGELFVTPAPPYATNWWRPVWTSR